MELGIREYRKYRIKVIVQQSGEPPLNGRLIWHEWRGQVSLHRLTFVPKKEDCANRIVVLTVAS